MKIANLRSALAITPCVLLAAATQAGAQGGVFDIATSPQREATITAEFDGTNYLVGMQGNNTDDSMVVVQFVSPVGTLIGPAVSTGRTGGVPLLAFGNGSYLLAWTDDATSPDNHIYGQLISPSGTQGALIPISTASGDEDIGGVAAGLGAYLVTYYREDSGNPGLGRLYGRLVTTVGTVRPEFQISSGYTNYGQGNLNNASFDGSGYLVVWIDGQNDSEVRGRRINASGMPGPEFSIDAQPGPSDQPLSICFDGNAHLVVWNEQDIATGNPHWDILARRVSPGGALLGSVIPVCTAPGDQYAPFVDSASGLSLITWTELRNDLDGDWMCDAGEATCADVFGRFLDGSGTLLGSEWPLIMFDGDQYGSPVAAGAGQFLMAWNEGNFPPPTLGGDVYGTLVPTAGIPTIYCVAKLNSAGCLPEIGFSGIPSATAPEPFEIDCVNVISQHFGLLFYGLDPNNLPFQGGTLCVKTSLTRTPIQPSGGNPPPLDCSGTFNFDFNAYVQGGSDPNLFVGQQVYAQYWYRDPLGPAYPSGLSDALTFQILP